MTCIHHGDHLDPILTAELGAQISRRALRGRRGAERWDCHPRGGAALPCPLGALLARAGWALLTSAIKPLAVLGLHRALGG